MPYRTGCVSQEYRPVVAVTHTECIDGDQATFFDVTIEPELQRPAEHASVPTTFVMGEEWACYADREKAVVAVKMNELTRRKGLLFMAHELGHTYDMPLILGALGLALGETVHGGVGEKLESFEPAVAHLTRATARSTALGNELERLLGAEPPVARTAAELFDDSINVNRYYPASSIEGGIAVSALREAAAWQRALLLVRDGSLNPGLATPHMHDAARRAVATYDNLWQTTLHEQTFSHMLARST